MTLDSAPAAQTRSADDAAAATRLNRRDLIHLGLLLPSLFLIGALFLYPMLGVLERSLGTAGTPTLHYYMIPLEHPVYIKVFAITFEISLSVTVITLAAAYPLAYTITTSRPLFARLLIACVLLPFFTSLLVRTYAWMAILSPTGILPGGLASVGLPAVSLLYSRPAVLIAMTYSLLPYMVLTIYSVMRGIDRDLVLAAASLGASPWQAFRRVFLPLSLPGVAGGSILVFMLAVGYFITPRLVGGPGDQMIAMVIADEMEQTAEWGFPAALTVILLVLVLVGFTVVQRFLGDTLRSQAHR